MSSIFQTLRDYKNCNNKRGYTQNIFQVKQWSDFRYTEEVMIQRQISVPQ